MIKQITFGWRLKHFLSFYFLLFLISCSARAQTISEINSLDLEDDKLIISLFGTQDNGKKIIQEFSYIPFYQDLLYSFPNGSILGFLPSKDVDLKIKRWNDFNHEFTLFYCDSKTGELRTLKKNNGWNFHIVDSQDLETRWIVIFQEGTAELFLMHEDGSISNKINIQISFNPDFVEFKEVNGSVGNLLFGVIDREAIYKIDFEKNTVQLIDDYATEAH